MKAIIQEQYGPAELLRLEDVDPPEPGEGEVLIRVRAASVHADVWHMVLGVPYVLRLMGAGLTRPSNPIPGTDVAGVVDRVGPGVTRFRPGDAVFGEVIAGMQWRNGGAFAEYATAEETRIEPKPPTLGFIEAACVPTSGLIALMAVRREARVAPGLRVLVNGAAGAVGSFAVQIAKADGAHVTAVDAGDRADLLRSLGADEVVDYREHDYTQGDDRYDVVIDIPGNHPYPVVRRVLTERGRYVWIGHDEYGADGRTWLGSLPGGIGMMLRAVVDSHLPLATSASPGDGALAELAELAKAGWLAPVIDRTFPLAETGAAIEYLASGQARGRVVVTVP